MESHLLKKSASTTPSELPATKSEAEWIILAGESFRLTLLTPRSLREHAMR